MKEIILAFLEKPITLDADKLATIICLNKDRYIEIVKGFSTEFFRSKNVLEVYKDGIKSQSNDYIYIPNVLALDINNKKNINALYKLLRMKYAVTFNTELNKIKEIIEHITTEIGIDFDIKVCANKTIDMEDIFKISSLLFEENYENVIEILVEFISISTELLRSKIIVIQNLHSVLSEDQIDLLVKEFAYKEVKIINVEFAKYFNQSSLESAILIDEDCVELR